MKPEEGSAAAQAAARRSVHAEMSAASADTDGVPAAAAADSFLSLGDDTLAVNLGIPVIVVLTKVCLHCLLVVIVNNSE